MAPEIYLLPDTNVLLHFPPLADVDWLSLTGVKSAIILIAPVVNRELNKHKDAPRSRKLRDKASAILRDFHARFKGTMPSELRPGVEIAFISQDPSIDFSAYGLVRDLNDDWLIATALQAKIDKAPIRVVVLTADFGLEVKATALLEAIQMPESLRIPEELGSDEKKILELQQRLRAIQVSSPSLKVVSENKNSFADFKLFKFARLTAENVDDQIQKARQEYPKIPSLPKTLDLSLITNQQIERYNERIDTYLENLSLYHKQSNERATWYNRTAEIKLLLSNTGGSPAEDIDIIVHTPDGMDVLDDEGLPEEFEPPDPPGTFADAMARMFATPNINISALNPRFTTPSLPENAQLLGIKKTKSYDVQFYVERLKHQNHEQLPSIYLHFSSEPMSFRAEYRIVAANVPEPIVGTLDLIYKAE